MILKRDQGNPHRVYNRMLEVGLENHDLLKALVDNGRYDLVYRYAEQRFRLMSSLYPGSLPELDEAADFRTQLPGGHGAVYEAIRRLLIEQEKLDSVMERYRR